MAIELMSIKEVAEYLKIHEITVYNLTNEGKLPGFKVGGQWRFEKVIMEQWITNEIHKKKLIKEENNNKKT